MKKPMRILSALHRNQRGAASVLVIIMMVVLIIFGTLAFVTSTFNAKLGQRSLEWRTDYYWTEDQAEIWLESTDAVLLQAEQRAREYIALGGFSGEAAGISPEAALPAQAQEAIEQQWADVSQAASGREVFLTNWFSRIYYYHALTLLDEYVGTNDSWELLLPEGFDISHLLDPTSPWNAAKLRSNFAQIRNSLTSSADAKKHIDILLWLTLPEYDFTYNPNGTVSGLRRETPLTRFTIAQWQQWQDVDAPQVMDPPIFDGTLGEDALPPDATLPDEEPPQSE